ncbi:hypothetical protein NCCP1664_10390 [Zafaria cholistanensis]|uniref:Uncharacterized protein n=1 Tax=Zafaria cholistanensis TaxID=1682741 RepID=A0A5A7NQY6_9MICC|nr:hypothetical protein [Zafaria cholistanensis]GER22542.1 hypothetical protein NCCP1664_10390 [Zafaria cholistanensis]
MSLPPASPHSPASAQPRRPRRPRHAGKAATRAGGLLLVAAVVLGLGTTVDRGAAGNPGDSAPSAAGSPAESLRTQLASLLEEATALAAGPAPATPSAQPERDAEAGAETAHWPADELAAAREVLAAHVDLLTPGASPVPEPTSGASPSGGLPSGAAPPSPAPPSPAPPNAAPPEASEAPAAETPGPGTGAHAAPAAFAERLAQSANSLLTASLDAPEQLSRSLLSAGTEQALAAREVARAGGGQAAVKALPEVPLDAGAAWLAFETENGAGSGSGSGPAPAPAGSVSPHEPAASGGTAPSPGTGSTCQAQAALAGATDAAFRLAYAYQVAGARSRGDAAEGAWEAADDRERLGWRLQSRLPQECVPLRAAAYRLPPGFAKDPVRSAATGEEQLSALLRDAAGAAGGTLRAALAAESFSAALAAS